MNLKGQTPFFSSLLLLLLLFWFEDGSGQRCKCAPERIEKNVGEAFVVLDYLSKQESGCTRGGKPGKCLPYPN